MLRCLILTALVLPAAATAGVPTWSDIESDTGWEHLTTRNHDVAGPVQVYRTTIKDITCFMGEGHTTIARDKLLNVALDIKGTIDWSSADVSDGDILSRSGNELDYYQYLDVPGWTMASDRFWFLHGKIVEETNKTVFHWTRLENGGAHSAKHADIVAANSSAIEPPVNVGAWEFLSTGENNRIRYYVCTDAGGSIPRAVQNFGTKSTLPDNVGDIIREAKKR